MVLIKPRTSIHHLMGDAAHDSEARVKLTTIFGAEPEVRIGGWQSHGEDASDADAALVVNGEEVLWTKLSVFKSYINGHQWEASCHGAKALVGKSEFKESTKDPDKAVDLTRARARKKAEELGTKSLLAAFTKTAKEHRRNEALRDAKAGSEERARLLAEEARLCAELTKIREAIAQVDAVLTAAVDARLA